MTYDINSGIVYSHAYSSWFLWLMFSAQVYPGNVLNTSSWRVTDADMVVIWRGWYSADGGRGPAVCKLVVQDRETTVAEDIHLVESVPRGLGSRGYRPGFLVVDPNGGVNSDHHVIYLQRWIREAIDG